MASNTAVPTLVLEFWEQLFEDEASKDVQLKAQDGSVWVHSLILSQMSVPFKTMLSAGMSEQRTKKIKLDNFSIAQLKFVLRFMYTGHIDSSDWGEPQREGLGARSLCLPPQDIDSDDDSDDCFGHEPSCWGIVPLPVLLGSLSFAKQYEMPNLVGAILDYIRPGLCSSNFNEVMEHAVAIDLSPLKLMCMDYAKESHPIRKMYDNNQLSTEVSFELQAIWRAPSRKKARTRLF
mmetsp:Transcript_31696/g.62252  ORF Transcript_31696/g.62252 Transcript_31696/m.62252 type:complete len:234 (+) Transcript_31696:47-748(+)